MLDAPIAIRWPDLMPGDKGGDDKDSGKGVTDAVKPLIERLVDIFGVFDLSFFVAGAVCFGALAFCVYASSGPKPIELDLSKLVGLQSGAVIVACYVLGLVCFAAGRRIRWLFYPAAKLYRSLPSKLRDFGLHERYAAFLPEEPKADASPEAWWAYVGTMKHLYTRLWAEARQSKELIPSFNLLMRYWVMAAMCDGLAAAFLVWSAAWAYWVFAAAHPAIPPPSLVIKIAVLPASVAAFVACLGEGNRYGEYQMSELIASLAQRTPPSEQRTAPAVEPGKPAPAPQIQPPQAPT